MEVDVEPGDPPRFSAPRVVIPDLGGRFVTTTAPANNWDAAPDGNRFIFVEFERDERVLIRNLTPEDLDAVIALDSKVVGRRRDEFFKVKLEQALADR